MNVKSQGTEKFEVFFQGTDDFKNFRCETLYIAAYKYVNISSFAVLDINGLKKIAAIYGWKKIAT